MRGGRRVFWQAIEVVDGNSKDVRDLRDKLVIPALYNSNGELHNHFKGDDSSREKYEDSHCWYNVKFAKVDDVVIGHALYFTKFSLRTLKRKVVLEDIYIHPSWRNKGVGKSLWKAVCKAALDCNCTVLEITVSSLNSEAIEFYEQAGAVNASKMDDGRQLLHFDLSKLK